MAERIRPRRDIAASWTLSDAVLKNGEFGYETDTSRLKVGDGSTPWTSLLYFGQTSPQFVASFTFAQATADTSALAVANSSTSITLSDRSGRPAWSDGTDWIFSDGTIIS